MSYESFIHDIVAICKDAIEVSKSAKKDTVPMPTKSTEPYKTSPQVPAMPITNKAVASTYELNQFADYICRAKDGIPPNKNLRQDITPIGLPVRKTGDSTYDFMLFKIKNGEEFKRTTFHQFLKPQMNQALENVRFHTEYNVQQEQQNFNRQIKSANEDVTNPTSLFYQNTQHYYDVFNNAKECFCSYLQNHYYLLYGLQIIDFKDYDECIVVSIRCDYSYRISV